MTQITVLQASEARAHPLVARLTRLRSRVRVVVGLMGVGIIGASAVGAIFVLMFSDYLLNIPLALRVVLLLGWIGGIGVLVWRFLVMPLTTRLTDQFLASRIEQQNTHLADDLMSAVHFIHTRAGESNVLAARHIDAAAQKTAGIRFEDAVDFRPALKALGITLFIMLAVGVVGAMNPRLMGIAFERWFLGATTKWPHSNNVTFDWTAHGGKPPAVIPLGETFLVRAKVDKGPLPRVWLYDWVDQGRTRSQLMQHQKEQSGDGVFFFETTLEPKGRQLSLRVEAGDDREEPSISIRLAPRPEIAELQARIAPPEYAMKNATPEKMPVAGVVNLLAQTGRAAKGALVTLQIQATKPFKVNDRGEPEVWLNDQGTDKRLVMAMNRRLADSQTAEVAFAADKSIQARVMMLDVDGFENSVGGTATIEVIPDALPAVVITEPRRAVERSPSGVVEMVVQATDDWGFAGLRLRADKYDAKEGDPAAFELPSLPWTELTVDQAVGSTTGKSAYTWDLAPLKLQPGMRLSFYAEVKDNFVMDGKEHDWVRSAPLSLTIRSEADIQEAQRKGLAELTERIRNLKQQQEQTRAQTDAIRRMVEGNTAISPEMRNQLSNLAQQESQQAAAANSLQQRAAQIADDLRQNKMGEGELGKIAQEVSAGMREVGQQNMPRAASELTRAQEAANAAANQANQSAQAQQAQQAQQSMASATNQQDQAIAEMENMINRLGATGDFETLHNEAAKLLNQQAQIGKETRDLAPQIGGRPLNELTPEQRAREERLAAQQQEAMNKTVDLVNRMEQAAGQLSQSDQASAQSLENAAEAAKSSQVSGSQQQASQNISENQLENASNNQASAQQGLQQMLDELNKNDMRKLEQLVRDIRNLMEEVKKLREGQDKLKTETVAAAEAAQAAVQKLADRQGAMQQNAIIIQKKAQATPRVQAAANYIGEASNHMVDAAKALFDNKQKDAPDPQAKAIAALDLALAELKKVDDQVAPQLKDKQLAAYIAQYEEVKRDQSAIKESSDKFEVKRLAAIDKELDRADSVMVMRLATTQEGLMDRINRLSEDEKMKEVEVVVWMNKQVIEAMGRSKSRLEKEQLGAPLASAQQMSLDRIQMVIDALKEEQARKSEFANGGGGGGGGAGGGPPPLVPPMAQLKMLRAMQLTINTQTKSVDDSIKAATTDAQKNEYQMESQTLGQKQGQIKDIAGRLLESAGGGPAPAPATAPGGAPR